ncbi:MAG: ABC transporter permease [Ignavibacteria bacterium]|jgi:phospholipid/cholesterol/gamma-HCH transport system permease protein|nr:ABC transporter permease [Ignavibacteria bacterium]MCU7501756.1 ABC transporter permease [Ignavibacteria bacterium]MCU7516837.1 ABC transporter permease [Ignavibacteria bacterium]
MNEDESTIKVSFTEKIQKLQDYSLMVADVFRLSPSIGKNRASVLSEMYLIGTQAVFLVLVGGLFTGVILAIETGHNLEKFGATLMISRTVSYGMIRELGPAITGLLLAARTGAKNTSEIGAMQLSEQIDALKAFGLNPVEKLVIPRVFAALIMFLPLTMIADMAGILGGMFITNMTFNIDLAYFWNTAIHILQFKDIFVGAFKPILFSFFIASISCFYGLITRGGTTNLGKNAIHSVVTSSMVVILLDFIFTKVVWEIM